MIYLKNLKLFFDQKISWGDLKKTIKDDLDYYLKQIAKTGSTISFAIKEDDIALTISKDEILFLIDLYRKKILNESELNFIADVSYASENVNISSDIEDTFSLLTDPEINGPLESNLSEILSALN